MNIIIMNCINSLKNKYRTSTYILILTYFSFFIFYLKTFTNFSLFQKIISL